MVLGKRKTLDGGCVGRLLLTHPLLPCLCLAESFVCHIRELLETEGFRHDCMIYKPHVSINKDSDSSRLAHTYSG